MESCLILYVENSRRECSYSLGGLLSMFVQLIFLEESLQLKWRHESMLSYSELEKGIMLSGGPEKEDLE